jgi:hypothetical protein
VTTPVPVRNRLDVLAALRSSTTVVEAAAKLGLTIPELRAFAHRRHMGLALARLERPSRDAHPKLQDMTGRALAGGSIVVVERAGAAGHGNAQWRIRFTACGHLALREGIRLRADEKAGARPRCPTSKLGRAVYNQYTKLAMRERAKRLKEQGLCRCGRKNDRPGKTRCSSCVTRECGYSERRRAAQRGEPVPKLDRLQALTDRREADRQSIRRDVLIEVRAAWVRANSSDEFARWLKEQIEADRRSCQQKWREKKSRAA